MSAIFFRSEVMRAEATKMCPVSDSSLFQCWQSTSFKKTTLRKHISLCIDTWLSSNCQVIWKIMSKCCILNGVHRVFFFLFYSCRWRTNASRIGDRLVNYDVFFFFLRIERSNTSSIYMSHMRVMLHDNKSIRCVHCSMWRWEYK